MSHVKCPKCGGREHYAGYGFAAGGLGGYTICECGEVLERVPDQELNATDDKEPRGEDIVPRRKPKVGTADA